jgi:fermentation-respiration switch protein FrsA (DUF1100 family)
MEPHHKRKLFGYISLIVLLFTCISVSLLYYNDRTLIRNRESISFSAPNGDNLKGYYYPGTLNAGVLLLEGFGSDQIMMKGIAAEFAKLGFYVFSFDYSGHGSSMGTIGFDNAQTDTLALEVLEAKNQFLTRSGLDGSEILFLGHSLGSRVAVQAAVIDSNVAGLILLGTQINLDTNTQAEFFTGVTDTDLLWINSLNGSNPATEILLISGEWDDILTPNAADLLYNKLGGDTAPYGRELKIFKAMFHNYEVYSPRVITYGLNWAIDIFSLGIGEVKASTMVIRKTLWSVGVSSLFLTLILFNTFLNTDPRKKKDEIENQTSIHLTNPRKFLGTKLLLWLLSLPICVLTAGILSLIPIGVPVFNMIYVGFIAGYGIFMYLIYRFRKKKLIPGIHGRFSMKNDSNTNILQLIQGLGVVLMVMLLVTLYARSGIFVLFPLNFRLIWLFLFAIVTIPAYFISQLEQKWIFQMDNGNKQLTSSLHILIGYIPFILMAILYLILGSLSGLIGAVHGLIVIALVTILGNVLTKFINNLLIISIVQSFVLYYLVLPQTALFAFF